MPSAMAEAILEVAEGVLKTCRQYIQDIWYNTRAFSIVTTTKGTELFHKDMMEALNTFSQHSPQLGAVAEIYSTAATWEDVNDMVSLRCGENLVCWAVETLGRQWLENTEQRMALRNYDISNINDTDDGNGNSMGSLQDMRANTGKEKGTCLARSPWRGQYYQCPQVVAHELSNSIGEGSCKSSIRDPANVMKLTIQETTHHTLPTMKVTSSRLGVLRPSANVTAQWDEARGHAED